MAPDWVPIAREFGFPIAVLVIGAFALYKGILVLGRDANERLLDVVTGFESRIAEMEREKAYREERRVEERNNRLITEETLRSQVTVMRDMTELLKDIERNVERPRSGGGG